MSGRLTRFSCCLLGVVVAASRLSAFVADNNKWPSGTTITYQVQLGSSPSLLDGATSWLAVTQAAMTEWNGQMQDVQFAAVQATVGSQSESNRVNDLFFSDTHYGDAFGAQTLAVTLNIFEGFSQPLPRVEADIVFNNKSDLNWNSYRGARRNDVDDLRRVLIHELGHALGLDHPNDNSQDVSSIMNAFVSDIDTVTTDDIQGAQSLYGVRGGGGGSSGDSFESDNIASSATPIANGATQTHSIHEVGDKDWVSFTLPLGVTYLVTETSGASGDTEIFLFGPNSSTTAVASNDDWGNNTFSKIIRDSPTAGEYFLRVEEYSNNATIDSYAIKVSWRIGSLEGDSFEPDNTAETAVAISNGQTQNRSIHLDGDLDWATFTIVAGGATDFVIETAGPSTVDQFNLSRDTVLTLFGPNSTTTVLEENDDIDGGPGGSNRFSRISLGSLAAGTYHVRVMDYNNNDRIDGYTLRAAWTQVSTAKLSNLSVRAKTGGEFGTLILGFATSTASKEILIRGMGPTIADFGVQNPIRDPRLDMVLNGAVIHEVDDWINEPNVSDIRTRSAALGAFAPTWSFEAMLLRSFEPNPYTVLVTDAFGDTGEVLIEAYDADSSDAAGRLTNLSTRTQVGGSAGILTAGFVIAGTGDLTLLIRGVGPTLADYGVSDVMGDPTLRVISSATGADVGFNDDWGFASDASESDFRTAASAVGAFALREGSTDAALLVTLPPGVYTVQMDAYGNMSPGTGLVEIYEVRNYGNLSK